MSAGFINLASFDASVVTNTLPPACIMAADHSLHCGQRTEVHLCLVMVKLVSNAESLVLKELEICYLKAEQCSSPRIQQ